MSLMGNQHFVSAADLGLNGVALNAERTSNWISVRGRSDVTVLYEYTHGSGTATEIQFEVDSTEDEKAATPNAYEWMGGSLAQTATDTEETLKPYKVRRAVSAAQKGRFTLKVNDPAIRIRVNSTSGGASDTLKVRLLLGAQGA